MAFVVLDDGVFERRFVDIGPTLDGWTEIKAGLAKGERVVSEGSFLVKSEFLKGSIEE
jgi:cobalt-zinc-cadmium efflux system membrane fusion protein